MSPSQAFSWRPRAAAALLVLAAGLHAAVIREHFHEWTPAGVFFSALVIAEAALAIAILRRPDNRTVGLALGVSLATVAVWTVSRTFGLPFGPEAYRPEAIGVIDMLSTLAEVSTVAVLLRPRPSRRLVPVALAIAVVTAACGGSGGGASAAKKTSTRVQQVVIDTFAFAPKTLSVKVGTTVSWTNHDDITHTVTSGTREYDPANSGSVTATHKSGTFDKPLAGKGATFSFTFKKAGAYHYFCDRHPGMEADVHVG